LLLRFEALFFEAMENAETLSQAVDQSVPIVVEDVRQDESLLVLMDQESLELARLLNKDAAETPYEHVLVAEGYDAHHI
jgi:hypothetical protein